MKKIIKTAAFMTSLLFLAAMSGSSLSAQQVQNNPDQKKLLPLEVMKIAQKSCAKCHIDGAMAGLRFTEWDSYSPGKQASKAQAICKAVTDKIMPPKGFIKKNPDAAPTVDDVKTLCDWAATFIPKK